MKPAPRFRLAAIQLAIAAAVGYLLAPTHMPLMQFIHPRFATLGALLFALSIPLAPGASPRSWRAALAVLCAAHALFLVIEFRRFDAEAGDFRSLAEQVEPGSCVATLGGYMETGVMRDPGAYTHFAGYISLWRGAVPGYTFARTRHSPLALRGRGGAHAPTIASAILPEVQAEAAFIRSGALFKVYGGFYRYFLLPSSRSPAEFFGAESGRLVRIGVSGPVALYLNEDGRCGV